jgi:hypothetical protein
MSGAARERADLYRNTVVADAANVAEDNVAGNSPRKSEPAS